MQRLRAAGLAGLLAMLIAACSSQASTTPTSSTTPIASTSATVAASSSPTTEPSASAAASESIVSIPSFQLPNGDKALEDVLPDELGGQPLTKYSMGGADFLNMGTTGDNQEFADFLKRLNAKPEDISVAFGGTLTEPPSAVSAFRVKGADQDRLTDEFKTSIEQDADTKLSWSTETISGKSVLTTTDPTNADEGKLYVYPKGDIIFFVTTADPTIASEAFSKLP